MNSSTILGMPGLRFRQVLKICYQFEAKWAGAWCFVLGFAQDEKFLSLLLKSRCQTNSSGKTHSSTRFLETVIFSTLRLLGKAVEVL